MDFIFKYLIYFKLILLYSIVGCFSTCSKGPFRDCTYDIVCSRHLSPQLNFPCSAPYNVSIIIKDSVLDALTSGFFSSTNFDERVRHVISQNNNWLTIETDAFYNFPYILTLNLPASGIVKINDKAFNRLTNLKTLDLSNNNIERLCQKSFFITAENSLEDLDLSSNKLYHLQEDAFSYLTKLIKLNLQNNRITSMSNNCFSNLKSLTILFLQNNNITRLNSTLLPLKELKYLDVSYNEITKITGYETSHLGVLLYLNISYNALEIVEVNCFLLATNLEFLDVSHNKISSIIDPVMFMNTHSLRHINFYDNKITTIKDLTFQFNPIEYINFERNNLSININRNTLKGLSNVDNINITQQNITAIKEKAFTDMQHLLYLNLSKNQISSVDNTSFEFENGSALIILDLSYNYINELFFLQYFTSDIKEFYINNNKLTVLRKGIFDNHRKIIRLDVSENKIIIIELNSLPLSSVQYLNIERNNLSGNITKNMLSPAPFLRYLDVNNFEYKRINENAFENLQLLARLNLSNNELEFINSNNFINMEKIYSLDLSNNKLADFNATGLDKLKAIYLNNNNFTRLPKLFSNISEIIYIDVSDNFISDLDNAGFEDVRNITVLKMSKNGIKVFNSEPTNNLTKLSDLILSSNQISAIKLTYFEALVRVDLSNNNITFVNQIILSNLYSLQYLDLSANKIKELPPGSFQQLKILKLLNVSSNFIQNLRFGIFKGLGKTEIIDLSRNKITSLDVNIFHECKELKKLIVDYNFIKTINVDKLIFVVPKIMSLSIGSNPLSCEEIVRNKRLEESRRFEVTSINKIFYEDNVHGIKCGDTNDNFAIDENVSSVTNNHKSQEKVGSSTPTILATWCLVLTILIVLAAAYFWYSRRGKIIMLKEPTICQNNSINISRNYFNNDLLN